MRGLGIGQGDRTKELVRQYRSEDPRLSLYDAVDRAQAAVIAETEIVRDRASDAVVVGRGRSTLNGRQIDLLCKNDLGTLALETRLEADRKLDVARRRAQRG